MLLAVCTMARVLTLDSVVDLSVTVVAGLVTIVLTAGSRPVGNQAGKLVVKIKSSLNGSTYLIARSTSGV
jgi:hypothetical protein